MKDMSNIIGRFVVGCQTEWRESSEVGDRSGGKVAERSRKKSWRRITEMRRSSSVSRVGRLKMS